MSEYIIHRDYDEKYLEHHGVKGMKWGVRKKSNASDERKQLKKQLKKQYHDDKKQLRKIYHAGEKQVKKMSNEDLKKIISNTAAVTSGALWIASAFIPGNVAGVLNGAAAVANIVSITSGNNPEDKAGE